MATASVRKPASRPAKPATRYWKGKAPKGATEVVSDSDQDEEYVSQEEGDVPISNEQDFLEIAEEESTLSIRKEAMKGMDIVLKEVNPEEPTVGETKETEETTDEGESEESDEEDLPRPPGLASQGDDESSEEDESEEEFKPQFRPIFVSKRARVTILETEVISQDSEEAIRKKELIAAERKKQSHDLVAESIKRELAEKEKEELIPDVDDTDGLDKDAEFEAWRLRELSRIKKEKELQAAKEKEREEIERRRALPEEQRLKEDVERAQKLREEKPKGQQKFLQKYWHKGAFHQDFEILKRHDFTKATESTIDVTMLPKVMQVRDFGKRSRTKYTHLLDQDTTMPTGGFGGAASIKSGGTNTGCFLCGGPHLKKDCPQNTGPMHLTRGGGPSGTASGANASTTSGARQWGSKKDGYPPRHERDRAPSRDDERPWRERTRDSGREEDERAWLERAHDPRRDDVRSRWKDPDRSGRYGGRDRYESGRRSLRRSRSRSRSRSPAPSAEHGEDRTHVKIDYEGRDRDKRRRLE